MNISRREFLASASSAYFLTLLCSKNTTAQFPKPLTDLNVSKTEKRKWSYAGCSLKTASDVSGALEGNEFGTSTGNAALDQGLSRELSYLKAYYGINPGVFTYSDNNAFATPERIQNHKYPDGTVVLGKKLILELFNKFSNKSQISMGDHAVVGVMAHEFGHIAYFKSGYRMPSGKKPELHADFLAGWYIGIRALQLPGQINLQEIAKEMFDIGDFNFDSPSHHGTPEERAEMYTKGLMLTLNSKGQTSFVNAFNYGLKILSL